MARIVHGITLVACLFSAFAVSAQEWENEECLDCHVYPDVVEIAEENPRPGLVFDLEEFDRSTHAGLLCSDCHISISELPHEPTLPDVGVEDCAVCHGADDYLDSVHGLAWLEESPDAATCADCHGTHDVQYIDEADSSVYALRVADTCGSCHTNEILESYLSSPHGEAVMGAGLSVAATCTDCHGGHDVWPTDEERSFIHPQTQPETCGTCHEGILNQYSDSIHGEMLASGNTAASRAADESLAPDSAPTCATCHRPHEETAPIGQGFAALAVEECQGCHAEYVDTFRGTYHGKVNALGADTDGRIAACSSCHTAHHILPASDPASTVSPDMRLDTCRQCHPSATENFADYQVHADPTDPDEHPGLFLVLAGMTTLLSTVMIGGITHTALWYRRLRKERIDAGLSAWAHPGSDAEEGKRQVMRLSAYNRVLHIIVMTSFLLLVVTGIPLHFSEAGWARWLMSSLGGFETAAWLHRVGGVMTGLYAVMHLGNLFYRRWVQGEKGIVFGEDTLVPRYSDLKEAIAHVKWFFGKGERPQFGRWAYWEKFDYFAVFFGVTVIGTSGLILWFPELFTRLLPGWVINVATIIHADEALLAMSFIFTVHFFNAHLRPGKFPMDPVFMTGRISIEEMKHDHPREYIRLEESGKLDEAIVEPADEVTRHWAKLVGYPAILIGLAMLFAVIATLAAHLLG